jgi:hypothetical protein
MSGQLTHLIAVVLSVGLVQASLGDVIDPNLIGWWKFDEDAGTATPPSSQIAPVQDLGIGWDIGMKDFWFRGTIDEVRLYSYALSKEETAWLAGGR